MKENNQDNKHLKFVMAIDKKDVEILKTNGFLFIQKINNGKEEVFLFANNPSKLNFIDESNMNLIFTNKLMFG